MIYKNNNGGVFVISANKTIFNLQVNDAAKKIGESKYGLHCLFVYPNFKRLTEFYTRYIKAQIDKKNEIILFNPFCETVDAASQNLSMGYMQPDEFQHESDVFLIIADSLNQYFGKVPMMEFKE